MKRKLFCLLTLLLTVCSGAWADSGSIIITWPMVDGENKLSKVGTASVADIVTVNDVTLSTDKLEWNGQRNLQYSYNGSSYDETFYAGGITNNQTNTSDNSHVSTGYASFSFTLPIGVTFTPTNFSFKAGRQGTDNGCIQGSFDYSQESVVKTATTTVYQPARTDVTKSPYAASNPQSVDITGADAITEGNTVTLKIYFGGKNNSKTIYFADVKISGNYTKSEVVTYTLTTNADPVAGGTISRTPNVDKFKAGTSVTLTATPNYGYEFVNWTKGGVQVSTSAEYAITTADEDETYVAHFNALTTYDVTASASPVAGGTVVKSPDHDSYIAGDDLTITATPNTGYKFVNWTINGVTGETTNPLSIEDIAEAKTIVANFEQLKSITFSKGSSGAVGNLPATEYVDVNANYTLPAAPYMYKSGYTLTAWNDGESDHAIGSNMTITENTTLTAVYTANTVNLGDAPAVINWIFARNSGAPTLICEGAEMDYVQRTTISETAYEAVMHVDTRSGKVISGYNQNGKLNNSNNDTYAQVNKGTKFTIPVVEGATITYTTTHGTPAVGDVTFGGENGTLSSRVFTYVYHGAIGTLDVIAEVSDLYPSGISVSYPKYVPGPSDPETVGGDAITWDFSSTDAWEIALKGGTFNTTSNDSPVNTTLYSTNQKNTIIYVAGKKDSKTDTHIAANGSTKTNSRYFVLGISSTGTLGLTTNGNEGEFVIKKAATASTTWGEATAFDPAVTITTTASGTEATGSITYDAENPYILIGFPDDKRNIQKISWTPASDDVTMTTSVNMDGWRSFVDATQAYTIKEGETSTKAYIAKSVGENDVVLSEYDGIIYKNMPVLLKTDRDDRTIVLTKNESDDSYAGSNKLKVTTAGNPYTNILRLGYGTSGVDGAVGVGFYPYSTASAPAGVVYLDAPTSARALSIVFEDEGETTAISEVRGLKADVRDEFYNLKGQRVAQPTKGLYIVNGRKVVIK